mmetsp:Transcript_29119/g.28158  ORF Transcript_29119/g.28158 Transcript_29119/m.28158 type:complete len:221 (+) Transcript_29119:929-1591(+)
MDAIWRLVAVTLHLGELEFDGSTYNESGTPCSIKNKDKIELIAKLLGSDNPSDLTQEIVNKAPMPNSKVRSPYKINECTDSKNSLAKAVFDNLFNWLVLRMNTTILPPGEGTDAFASESKTIGLLDIFGFENFKDNNYEQMCINYVNEKLHKLYISAIFDAEKIELRNEGLEDRIAGLQYPSLQSLDVIKLLDERLQVAAKGSKTESKNGIFLIVNDCST